MTSSGTDTPNWGRLPVICWAIAGVFCFLLTRDLYGRTPAWIAVLLFATLPFFFAIGFFMTPDAPLTAAWAGTLYFLSQALLRSRAGVWWAAGLCLGLGLLSKYTIALLGPAALLYMLMNPDARRWLEQALPLCDVVTVIRTASGSDPARN